MEETIQIDKPPL